MATRLASLGAQITTWGLLDEEEASGIGVSSSVCEALGGSRCVILPMPAFDSEGRLMCARSGAGGHCVSAEWLLSHVDPGTCVYGGLLSEQVCAMAQARDIRLLDYAAMEEVQVMNAVPTVEGALCLAMQALDVTLWRARVAVLGYGRIGALLAERLGQMGAFVTVAARKSRDVARAEVAGHRALWMKGETSLAPLTTGFDVIFNTIPSRVLSPSLMKNMPKETVMIELASKPGGWDPKGEMSCRTIYAPGLPAKHAPLTAGRILADCLWPLLKEGSVQ
jgi:dipicolinate synthase subunit A